MNPYALGLRRGPHLKQRVALVDRRRRRRRRMHAHCVIVGSLEAQIVYLRAQPCTRPYQLVSFPLNRAHA